MPGLLTDAGYGEFVNVQVRSRSLGLDQVQPGPWFTNVSLRSATVVSDSGVAALSFSGGSLSVQPGNSGITGISQNFRGKMKLDESQAEIELYCPR